MITPRCDVSTNACDQMGRAMRAAVDQTELVERAGRGDHDAFALLARAASPRLDAVARLILRDRDLAQDAIQETLLKAWRELPGLRDPGRLDAWLHRLTINACYDIHRRRRRHTVELQQPEIDRAGNTDVGGEVADRDQLERGFRRLGVDQRAVLVLHYYLGLPVAEIASTLGIPLGTAQSRLHRALAAMRAALDADARVGAHVREGWPA
jgi:RNA polymerase sigma-70 factor (ECF subfamily)